MPDARSDSEVLGGAEGAGGFDRDVGGVRRSRDLRHRTQARRRLATRRESTVEAINHLVDPASGLDPRAQGGRLSGLMIVDSDESQDYES